MAQAVNMDDVKEFFDAMDLNSDGRLTAEELGVLLKQCGESVPGYQLRDYIATYDTDRNGCITYDEFIKLYSDMQAGKASANFLKSVKAKEGIKAEQGTSEVSATGTTHSYSEEEKVAFTDFINSQLEDDPDLTGKLPLSGDGLFQAVDDGILLCKMINLSSPNTIDERAITKQKLNVYKKSENLTLALNSARSIGCSIVNIDPQDLQKGTKHLVLGMVWQIIRIGLFSKIDLHNVPGLLRLLKDGETLEDLLKLSPEELLIRWVNYHMEQAGSMRRIKDFSGDIKDSEVYSVLLKQICPKEIPLSHVDLANKSLEMRADQVLNNAEKMDCRAFVTAKDIVKGNAKLNMAFVANLFNHFPALEPMEDVEYEDVEETREERTFRNWMNSLNVSPHVHHLYSDMCDGLVLLQLIDIVKPGTVNWSKVNQGEKLKKMGGNMKRIENCNYCIDLGKQMKFSLVGIGGEDIYNGTQNLTLALIWQLMRAYTLGILQKLSGSDNPITDSAVVEWVNKTLEEAGKSSRLMSFQDQAISNTPIILDLIDSIKPGCVNYDLYVDSQDDDEKLRNAQYTISIARKHGAMVYALPEDIVEVKPKMVMTIFACLMALGLGLSRQK